MIRRAHGRDPWVAQDDIPRTSPGLQLPATLELPMALAILKGFGHVDQNGKVAKAVIAGRTGRDVQIGARYRWSRLSATFEGGGR